MADFDRSCIDGPYRVPALDAQGQPTATMMPGFWFIVSMAVYDEAVAGLTTAQKATVDSYVQHPTASTYPYGVPCWAGDDDPWPGTVFLKVGTMAQARTALAKRYR